MPASVRIAMPIRRAGRARRRRRPAWLDRSFAALSLLLALIAFVGPAHARAIRPSRPNILFILSDDHAAQAISAYGSYRNRTPNMDRLATAGIRFAHCFAANSICAPSRATILTGKHAHLTGHTSNDRLFDTRQRTFPGLLREAGYQTALIGKWHLGSEPTGFDYWDVLIDQGVYYNPPMVRNGQYLEHTGYVTDILTDLTIDWLETQRDPARPFLLLSHHKAPHRSWEPALRHLTMYEDSLVREPMTLFDDWSHRSSAWSHSEMSIARHLYPGDLHLEVPDWLMNATQRAAWDSVYEPKNREFRDAKLAGQELTKWKYQRYAKDYLRTVAAVDEGIGRILDYLETSGLAANTVVIYSSDQGWFLGEHGMFDKRWMYEESLRMPLLIRWPGVVAPGTVEPHLVQNLDFAPTILEIAGVKPPGDMQGRSLVPLLRGRAPANWRRSVYYHFYEDQGGHRVPRHYGVRTERYKLIHYYGIGEWELFDLATDPNELTSLHDRPEHAGTIARLKGELEALRKRYQVSDAADREYDAFSRQQQQRWGLLSRLGRLPPRWGIGVDTLGVEEFETYRREHLAYRIGDQRVEAFVLVPRGRRGPMPAVVAIHPGRERGSYGEGKSVVAGVTQDRRLAYGLELCQRGFVVMCPDRLGFESRRLGDSGSPGAERDPLLRAAADRLVANGSSLLGQELAELWFAAAYLARRPDVHYHRVGVMGHGEGGLLAALLAFVDEEIRAIVSSNGTREFPSGDQDISPLLVVPGILEWGGIGDVISGIHPRPFLEVSAEGGRSEALAKAFARYQDLHFAERLRVVEYERSRVELPREIRERAYRWLENWLK